MRKTSRQKELITNSHRTDKHSALKQGLVDTLLIGEPNLRTQKYYTRVIVIVKQYDLWIG